MKKILPILFIPAILLVFISVYGYNNNPKTIISKLNNNSDIPISKLRYRINFAGILPVGEAIFETKKTEEYRGQQVYHLTASAQSLNIFAKFFNSYAILNSYVDAQQFNPVLFRQKLVVKDRKDIEKEVIYDQKQGIMSIDGVRRQIFANTQDPLSAMFNVRRMDFDKIKEFEMNINTNQKNYLLKGVAHIKDISIKKKIYKTVLLEAKIIRRDRNPYHKSTITMLLLKEKNNIPILIKAFAGGILINARLIDIQ